MSPKRGRPAIGSLSQAAELVASVLEPDRPASFSEVRRLLSRTPAAGGRSSSWAAVTAHRGLAELVKEGKAAQFQGEGYFLIERSDRLVTELRAALDFFRWDLAKLEGRSRRTPVPEWAGDARDSWSKVEAAYASLLAHVTRALSNPARRRRPRGSLRTLPPRSARRHRLSADLLGARVSEVKVRPIPSQRRGA